MASVSQPGRDDKFEMKRCTFDLVVELDNGKSISLLVGHDSILVTQGNGVTVSLDIVGNMPAFRATNSTHR